MVHKQRTQRLGHSIDGSRPPQKTYSAKEATAFPSVGVSLPSYRSSSTAQATSSLPQSTHKSVNTVGKPKTRKNWRKRIIIGLIIIIIVVAGWLGGKILFNLQKLFGGGVFDVLQTAKLKGEDTGRVNILLAGNSADDAGHQGAELTDSIMVVSIDTKQNTAYTLSIPRDLWVDVPDSGFQKINSAYVAGEVNEFSENSYPAGGMGQLEQVVEDNFGINIHYYALVNYNALKQAVDAVGGVDFNVKSEDPRGLFDPNIDYTNGKALVNLKNGNNKLTGQQALNLARARGDSSRSYGFPQSDFNRADNQRQLLTALKTKAVSAGVLSNPAKISSLADAIGGNVTTDLELNEVRRLYDLTKDIGSDKIKSVSLNDADGVNLLANYSAPGGLSALIPAAGIQDYSDIKNFLERLNSSDPVVREGAKVVILNGTDTMGLAGLVRAKLINKNVNVTEVGDAIATQPTSTIIDLTAKTGSKPGTKKLLTQDFSATSTTTNPYANLYDADFIVVLGTSEATRQAEN